MKKTLLLLAFIVSAMASSQTYTIDNISYSVTGGANVAVTGSTLTDVIIPETIDTGVDGIYTVTSVAVDAFSGSSITSVEFPSTVTTLNNQAFRNCNVLTTITFTTTNSITSIGSKGFEKNYLLTDASANSLLSSIVSIGAYGFFGNYAITDLVLPSTLTTLGEGVFRDCNGLKSADLSNTQVIILSNTMFQDNELMDTVLLPSTLTTIGINTFTNSVITKINIPAAVTSIGSNAFLNCSALTSVQVNSDTPVTIDATVFSGTMIPANATLYVPSPTGEGNYYAPTAIGWQDFGTILTGTLSTEGFEQGTFKIFPNPTSGIVTINNSQLKNANVEVYSLGGKLLLNKK